MFFSYFFLYILVNEKEKGKKKIPTDRVAVFGPPVGQETIYHLRVALALDVHGMLVSPLSLNYNNNIDLPMSALTNCTYFVSIRVYCDDLTL